MPPEVQHDFVVSVLRRPRMYTYTGSYYETITFLTAYMSGLGAAPSTLAPHRNAAPWFEFRDWLRARANVGPPTESADPFQRLAAEHPGDEQALEALRRLYREFIAEHHQGASPPIPPKDHTP